MAPRYRTLFHEMGYPVAPDVLGSDQDNQIPAALRAEVGKESLQVTTAVTEEGEDPT